MESEREIEIEKYVDLAYRRDREVPIPWFFEHLSQRPNSSAMKHIYPLSNFVLPGMEPLRFPSDLHVSSNYFDLSWTGQRRIKNAAIVCFFCILGACCCFSWERRKRVKHEDRNNMYMSRHVCKYKCVYICRYIHTYKESGFICFSLFLPPPFSLLFSLPSSYRY